MAQSAKPGEGLSFYETLSIQMQFVVPLIRRLQDVLGEQVVMDALEEANRREQIAARDSFPTGVEADCSRLIKKLDFIMHDALDYEVLRSEKGAADFDVKACRYQRLMKSLDAEDIGTAIICNMDYSYAEKAGMELTRTQTCMKGGSHCDFRYKPRAIKQVDVVSDETKRVRLDMSKAKKR